MSENNMPNIPEPSDIPELFRKDNWFNEDISGLWLDFTEPYKPPRWTLSHKGVPFANLGELHVVTGKSGHGKTSFMSLLIGAILKGEYCGLRYELSDEIPNPVVLYIDTEQGKDDSIAIKNRVCQLAGLDYRQEQPQFRYIRMRETEEAQQRWKQMLKAVYEVKPNIIFMDGMLDIVNDYNNQEECQPIVRKFMKLAVYYNASVWCVLHENPTFDKMVGTLGSVLERKVTEAFAVRKHKQDNMPKKDRRTDRPPVYFTVEQKKARRYDLTDWDFEVLNVNEWGMPREIDDDMPQTDCKPETLKKWIEDRRNDLTWPATRADIYHSIFQPNGIEDEQEQKAVMDICLNRRFFLFLSTAEMKDGQKNRRLKLNDEIFK